MRQLGHLSFLPIWLDDISLLLSLLLRQLQKFSPTPEAHHEKLLFNYSLPSRYRPPLRQPEANVFRRRQPCRGPAFKRPADRAVYDRLVEAWRRQQRGGEGWVEEWVRWVGGGAGSAVRHRRGSGGGAGGGGGHVSDACWEGAHDAWVGAGGDWACFARAWVCFGESFGYFCVLHLSRFW